MRITVEMHGPLQRFNRGGQSRAELENASYKVDRRNGAPEYETLAAFGSLLGVNDLAAICRANELCSLYSLDTISLGSTIAFAMECFEQGTLNREDTGGMDLRFGNAAAMLEVLELIARREGIGEVLADGSRKAAQRIGRDAEELSMQVKGVEFGMHDTLFAQEGRGMEAARSLGNLDPLPANDLSTAKVDRVKNQHLSRNFSDSMVTCHFAPWTLRQQVDMIRALTGWDYTDFEALRQGERVPTMARVFNLREGLTAADDQLPRRFFSPTPSGALKATAIDPDAMARAKRTFYVLMGWDPVTGVPTQDKLEELGIAWAAAAALPA